MNEDSLWEWLRDVTLPIGQYSRIESPDTAPGFPDVDYQIDQYVTGKIELKYGSGSVPFPNEDKGLHKSQKRWFKKNLAHWGNCWIIAEVEDKELGSSIYIIHGSEYEDFNGATKKQLFDMSVAVVYREEPENAAKILHNLLTTYRYDK